MTNSGTTHSTSGSDVDQRGALLVDEGDVAAPDSDDGVQRLARRPAREQLPRAALPLLLVLTFVIFGALSPELFLTWTNVRAVLTAQAPMLLLAVAVTIPLRAGDLDLSLAAVMVLCASLTGILGQEGVPLPLICLIVLLVGLGIGLVNAFFSVFVGLNGIIVSIGLFTAISGISFGIGGGELIAPIPQELFDAVNYKFLSLPMIVWIGWIVAATLLYVFDFTPIGRYLLFIGGNPNAAALAGVRVGRLRTASFATGTLIAAGTGILLAGYLGAVDSGSSSAYMIAPGTAAFLGTTTIQIGRVNVLGTVLGLYFLAFGVAGLQLQGIDGWVSDTFNGVALIFALTFARYFQMRGANAAKSRPDAVRDDGHGVGDPNATATSVDADVG